MVFFNIMNVSNIKNALLLVDVQNDFISGSLALKNCPAKEDGADIIPIINDEILQDQLCSQFFSIIVYTQDWHPKSHCSFIDNIEHSHFDYQSNIAKPTDVKVFDQVYLKYPLLNITYPQIMWPKHCIDNTWGAELCKDLKIAKPTGTIKDVQFLHKGCDRDIDCYSAFWSNEKFVSTGLKEKLDSLSIQNVYICGLALDICVYHTAMDSKDFGYNTYLIVDACRGVDTFKINEALVNMSDNGISIIQANQVYEHISNTQSQDKITNTQLKSQDKSRIRYKFFDR
ncbi:nicotinamidase-like isoform X2 [Gordionus sp. m RMFG-2023]|uniref:nicotinamidase-like isoform X2 n=1 Tax=Gordionus sp. m RMFG-2023 TaxID=3053472 RepID=UPI0031FC629F